jgi:hypothetical protein
LARREAIKEPNKLSQSWKHSRFISLAVLLCTLAGITLAPSRGQAHGLTAIGNVASFATINPGETLYLTLYDNAGPADKKWVVETQIGLNSGNGFNSLYFEFFLIDNSSLTEVARFEGATRDWIQVFTKPYEATLSAHVGGTFDLLLRITNADSTARVVSWASRAQYQ